jgi:hypothetical protein
MSSENTHDTNALANCFAPDATVRDEGRVRKGLITLFTLLESGLRAG